MNLAIQIVLYVGLAIQLFRPVDPAIYMPERHITHFGVILERLWRALKFFIAWLIVFVLLILLGVDF
jgi:hypothetical protein